MVQNEESVGDYLLNQGQEKINAYLEQSGIPAQIGGAIEQFGLIANNSSIKTLLEKSGLKGVLDQQLEGVSRNINGLKDQLQKGVQKAASAVDDQISSVKAQAKPLLDRTQQALDTTRSAETQVREGIETVRQLPGQAQAAAEQGIAQARGAAEEGVTQLRGAAEQGIAQARGAAEEGVTQLRGAAQEAVSGVRQGVQEAVSGVRQGAQAAAQRLSPEYLQSLTNEELVSATRQNIARKAGLLEQFTESNLPNRQAVFEELASQVKAERASYVNEAIRRGLTNEPARPTQRVSEEPNLRPSEVNPTAPEFQAPTQQLPQIPQRPVAPTEPVAPGEPPAPTQPPAPGEPAAPRVEPPSEIEPAYGPEPRPPGFVEPTEQIAQEGEQAVSTATKTEEAISTTQKVASGLEEATGGLPGIGEAGEILGALLQVGSLIASAFKPHEDVQTIVTPVSGFGFGSLNQFGVGGSSIV